MKISSSLKVGILALVALIIFFAAVLWVKGRSLSSAKRIEVEFKDVNGMRPGSAVQMMGMRVGQVEEIKPVIKSDKSFVQLKFVITEPSITIPKASMISIQQSGLIGEQFLEITPPKLKSVYVPVNTRGGAYGGVKVEIKLDDKYYNVGIVRKSHIMTTKAIPLNMQASIKSPYAYKLDYIIDFPGLILPMFMKGELLSSDNGTKLRIKPLDNSAIPYPIQTSPYTVIQPMRISDFMNLQYQAAESLTETNKKINELLDDSVIEDFKASISNVEKLTKQATTTLEKTEKLIDESRSDIQSIVDQINKVSDEFCALSKNVNSIIGDSEFKPTLIETTQSINKLIEKITPILGDVNSKQFANDLNATLSNVAEISASVNKMTKDEKLKSQIVTTVDNLNKALCNVSLTLETVNNTSDDKNIKSIVDDTAVTVHNLRKFSDKLNKRFLLFRLMF